MITILDNGKGAEEISRLLRTKNQVVKPGEKAEGSAFILTDGVSTKKIEKDIVKIIKKNVPVLAIGLGAFYIYEMFGAKIKKTADKDKKQQEKLIIEKSSPLLRDFKKFFTVVSNCCYESDGLPENFYVLAASKLNDYWVVQDSEMPLFCINFNPELGLDGVKLLGNFEKFIDVWEKYHNQT